MNTVKGLLGIKTTAQKQAEAAAKDAQNAQLRSLRGAEEDKALQAANDVNSARVLRGLGRRGLAFQGVESGLSPTLGG